MRQKPNNYRAAIYMRISRDDENMAESGSIQNQRELLKSFLSRHPDIELVREFSDDGYTGTNFDRPDFQRMMEAVQKKQITCIIVKDFSRLGRNYIETGRYIDQIFPMLGVRFISVNDDYDSLSESNESDRILIPFKNLINDFYCKDMSTKVRSQLDIKRKSGQFIGSFATYGYRKDPKDKNHLIIDEKAARIVQMIFRMKLDGYNPLRIADRLNEMGVLPPQQYKRSVGLNSNAGYWKSEEQKWCAQMVTRILINEIYTGSLVQGKNKKINYKVKKSLPVDKNDWIRVAGTHEPIIKKTTFDRVQEMLLMDTRTSPDEDKISVLSGFVKCADCGQNMVRRVCKRSGGKTYVYFTCSTAKAGEGCSHHLINAEKLEASVLAAVQNQLKLLFDHPAFNNALEAIPGDTHRMRILNNQITILDEEIIRYQEMKENLYEDYRDGLIDDEDYKELKQRFLHKIQKSKDALKKVMMEKKELLNNPIVPPEWVHEVKTLGMVNRLERKTVAMLIEKILVYDKNRIEVIFRYSDEIKAVLKESCEQAEVLQEGGKTA